MKGVRWRVGSISTQKVTTDVMTQSSTGSLYITSKRVFFDGAKKNMSIPLGESTSSLCSRMASGSRRKRERTRIFSVLQIGNSPGACLDAAAQEICVQASQVG